MCETLKNGCRRSSVHVLGWELKKCILGLVFICAVQMDPENKPTREELKEEVLKVSKGLVGLGGFNLVSARTHVGYIRVTNIIWTPLVENVEQNLVFS